MSGKPNRRDVLRAGAGVVFLPRLIHHDGVERLAKLFLETRRNRCPDLLAEELKKGVPIEDVYAAILLAAGRHVDVHHSLYVLDPAYRLGRAGPVDVRGVAPFLALDAFKQEQHDGPRLGWGPPRAELGRLMGVDGARREFDPAMRALDQDAAERALLSIAREDGPRAAYGRLWAYAPRDWSFIGHRAIATASMWRLCEALDWPKADVALRASVGAFFSRGGEDGAGQSYVANLERAREAWPVPRSGGASAARELLAVIRQGDVDGVGEHAARELSAGRMTVGNAWDAAHLGACELMWRHASLDGLGGKPLHACTAVNALHTCHDVCEDPAVKRLALLQALAWVAEFTRVGIEEGTLSERRITEIPEVVAEDPFAVLEPVGYPPSTRESGVLAVGAAYGALKGGGSAMDFGKRALELTAEMDVWNVHHLKFTAAVVEDAGRVSEEWRACVLASVMNWQHGERGRESSLVRRVRRG